MQEITDHGHMQHDEMPEKPETPCDHCEDGAEKATVKILQAHLAAKAEPIANPPVQSVLALEPRYASTPKAYQMRRWRDPPSKRTETPISLKTRLLT